MSIILEVSLSEAIDKLTILDIKRGKIKDERKKDIDYEYNYLLSKLNMYVSRYNYYYRILKKTNLEIWELQDILRTETIDKGKFYTICDEILNLNDSRYLVKKKINEISNSEFKEQKGYNLRILNIILNCDLDMITILNGAIRYYSFFYDEIILLSNNENTAYLKQMFHDDKFIKVNTIDASSTSEPKNSRECDNNDCVIVNNCDITVKLSHSFFSKQNRVTDVHNNKYSNEINNIYQKLGLNVSIFDEYRNIDSENA